MAPTAAVLRSPFLVAAALLLACQNPTSDDPPPNGQPRPVVSKATGQRFDAAIIDSARVTQDVLQIFVQYGGGCQTHNFALVSSGVFLESYPVRLGLNLAHDANGDRCKALKTSVERFDLRPVRQTYLTSYGQSGPLILELREPGQSGKVVSVRYDIR
ncbi:MAG: hypothetical protein K2Y26_15790 [Gemmatimonadaceae bacterium]|jgi:hypothetical protein|nr:hypothetical protein [Gemmatimonas sp.]MBX9856989.1 hypothetical protein [Gemmatimonadaceae bacterium]